MCAQELTYLYERIELQNYGNVKQIQFSSIENEMHFLYSFITNFMFYY
jgi:hypothetical protein